MRNGGAIMGGVRCDSRAPSCAPPAAFHLGILTALRLTSAAPVALLRRMAQAKRSKQRSRGRRRGLRTQQRCEAAARLARAPRGRQRGEQLRRCVLVKGPRPSGGCPSFPRLNTVLQHARAQQQLPSGSGRGAATCATEKARVAAREQRSQQRAQRSSGTEALATKLQWR